MRAILLILVLVGMMSPAGASTGTRRAELQVSAIVLSSCRVDSASEEAPQTTEVQRPRLRCSAEQLRPLVERRVEVYRPVALRSSASSGDEQGMRLIRYQIDY